MITIMNNIMMVIIILFFSASTIACESSKFTVYYFPLDMDFYIPPSPADIMKSGIRFEIDSCLLNDMFKDSYMSKKE